ncbi:type II toxin-antitoxin system VapC family toxin [Novosphingobium sp. ERW19]|nr:type II toxin-antitoxin system VapC family toxin [Novosphingobium sp. ERW19]NLR39097.1 type II toxin-antitoxin system VapC family toxin [Novosphingobium sp. ERW19]
MKYMLDTNAVIVAIEGDDPVFRARMAEADEGDIVMSSIVLAEVALGTEQGKPTPAKILEIFLEEVPVLAFDEKAARAYAKIPFKRASYDRLIAAHAISLGLTVVTANAKDFADVPGLVVENWSD